MDDLKVRRRTPSRHERLPCCAPHYECPCSRSHRTSLACCQFGDLVLAASEDGTLYYDEVSFLSLHSTDVPTAFFTQLTGEGNATILLTATHHVSVGLTCCSEVRQAKDVQPGDIIWRLAPPHRALNGEKKTPPAAYAGDRPVAERIIKVDHDVPAEGLHNPLLTRGGNPLVDGIVTSFNCPHARGRAKAWVPWLSLLCWSTGTCARVGQLITALECSKMHLEHKIWCALARLAHTPRSRHLARAPHPHLAHAPLRCARLRYARLRYASPYHALLVADTRRCCAPSAWSQGRALEVLRMGRLRQPPRMPPASRLHRRRRPHSAQRQATRRACSIFVDPGPDPGVHRD